MTTITMKAKRNLAVALLTLAVLYTIFCLVLLFIGCFTTITIFPGDHHGGKATAFTFTSGFVTVGLWMGGCFLYSDWADDQRRARLTKEKRV